MRIVVTLLVLAGCFGQCWAGGARKERPKSPAEMREAELKQTLAAGLLQFAVWCAENKLRDEARNRVDAAKEIDPALILPAALSGKLEGSSDADEKVRKEFETRGKTYNARFAQLYRELFAVKQAGRGQQAAADGFLLKAYAADPDGTEKLLAEQWGAAQQKGDYERVCNLLNGAQQVRSDSRRATLLKEIELKAAEKTPIQRACKTHAMQYLVSLPKGWSAAKKWPILVAVEGAGCDYRGACAGFTNQRGALPFIVVTPISLLNAPRFNPAVHPYKFPPEDQAQLDDAFKRPQFALKFDAAGLDAVLQEVRADFSGDEKIYITGFSGGGSLMWYMTLVQPQMVAAAAPACANYFPMLFAANTTAPERELLPIKAFQGDRDQYLNGAPGGPGLNAQWDQAKSAATAAGFTKLERVIVPGAGHVHCFKEVMAYFGSLVKQ